MANFEVIGNSDIELQLSKLKNPELAKEVVMAGAQPIADEIRARLKKNLQASKHTKGDLLKSLGITPPDVDYSGNTNTKIGFSGYDRKGVANVVKARAMESGTSRQRKQPFIRPAVNSKKEKAIQAMQDKINEKMEGRQ